MSEEWRAIPGLEGRWEVSNLGRVRSPPRKRTRGGLLTVRPNKRGYLAVGLGHHKHEVHRLVALAFIGPRPDGHEVRHVDGDPLNPAASNLTYGTRSQNVRDRRTHGTDHNVAKTHCPKGHPYDRENTRLYRDRRYCRTCGNRRHEERPRLPAGVETMSDLDPRWEWFEVTALGDPGPVWMQGQCRHLQVVPVAASADGETVAHLCLTCDAQLPAEWQP